MSMDKNSIRSLLNAAESGDCRKLEDCLKKNSVNDVNDQSQTALHYAAANGHQRAVRLLITKGAMLDCRNWCEWTPLMYAAYYGKLNVVTYLVENKADINLYNNRLVTPLICAARCGYTSVIEVLLEHGASVMPIKKIQVTEDNREQIFFSPTTALMAAAQHGHLGIVSLLMQYGMPIDYENPYTGYTALMLAAINGHTKIVELLVEKGTANTNLVNSRNQTAYVLSCLRKRTEVAAYLSERTQKRVEEIPAKFPPIIMAAKSGNIQEVEKIFRRNSSVDVNVFSDDGATPLIYASLNNHVDVVRLLLKKGAHTDIRDKLNGWTALMHATIKRHVEVVRVLLKAGADIKIKNSKGLAVFDLALLAGLPEITRLLVPRAIGIPSNESNDLDRDSKQKNFFSKVSGKMKRNPIVNRVPVHEIGLTGSNDVNDRVHTDELRKTSSVLSVLDANKSINGSDRPRISLVSPQVNLPDDVVVPVLSPYPKLQNFDIPKIPILGAKLSSSIGSNNGEAYNSSGDSTSFRALEQQSNATGIKRPKMAGSIASFSPFQEPDSPQSSMTSSGFTSVSRNNGRASMPNGPFKNANDRSAYSKSPFQQWPNSPPVHHHAFSPDHHTAMHMNQPHLFYQHQKSKTPPPHFTNDLPLRSVSSSASETERTDDISSLLKRLELEKYHSQFEDEEVDMEALREMDDGDLKMMGIDQTINRNLILQAVNDKQKSRSLQNLPANALYSPTPPGKVPSLLSANGHAKLPSVAYSTQSSRSGYQMV